jgi:hypothetical protein
MTGNINTFWLAAYFTLGQLQSFLVHSAPSTRAGLIVLAKTMATLLLSLTVWNLVFWAPSFFLDVLLTGKVSSDTLGYINTAFNFALFFGLFRGGARLVQWWRQRKEAAAEQEAADALAASTKAHPLLKEIEREQSVLINSSDNLKTPILARDSLAQS